MVWFWQLRGRLMGGVFVIMAPPGEGKSYIATAFALELMRDGVKVYSNFPILSVDGEYCSYEFTKELMFENLNGCAVFIDEGYTMFNSRKYMSFSDDDHDWFATSGHNEMMIFVIVQNINRVDKVIREVLNLLYVVSKTKIPIIDLPLWFTVESFLDVDDLKFWKMGLVESYSTEHIRFSVDVALAYDTKFFRKDTRPPFEGKSWIQVYKDNGLEFEPIPLNLIQKIKYRSGKVIVSWLYRISRTMTFGIVPILNIQLADRSIKALIGIHKGLITWSRTNCLTKMWIEKNEQRKLTNLWSLWNKWLQ